MVFAWDVPWYRLYYVLSIILDDLKICISNYFWLWIILTSERGRTVGLSNLNSIDISCPSSLVIYSREDIKPQFLFVYYIIAINTRLWRLTHLLQVWTV